VAINGIMGKEIIMKYSNGEITIVWKPGICSHSGICVKTLSKVYRPNEKSWIKIENASTNELIVQVEKCHSGSLSYYWNDQEKKTR